MTDLLSDLRAVANVNGDTYSSAEVIAMVRRSAEEIERLRAALQRIADDDVDADLKGRADILSGIAWAALNATEQTLGNEESNKVAQKS